MNLEYSQKGLKSVKGHRD